MVDPSEPSDPASDPAPRAAVDALADLVVGEVSGLLAELDPGRNYEVGMGTGLEADLGLDSLGVVELATRVEQATGRRVPDHLLADIDTVGDLCAVVTGAGLPARRDRGGTTRPPLQPGPPPEAAMSSEPPRTAGRSVMRTLYGCYALAVFGLVSLVAWPLIAVLPGLERRWQVVRAAGGVMFTATGIPVRVAGRERLPADGAYVVVANHTSFLDPLVLAMILPRPVVFTAVEGLAGHPVVRHFLRRLGSYLVLPGDRRRGVAAVTDLTAIVRTGRVVAMFPEGRRSVRPGLERFHLGAFQVAAAAQVPVVPIAIRGMRTILPVDRALPDRARVEVAVGEPVAATSQGWLGALELQRSAREQILRHCDDPDLA